MDESSETRTNGEPQQANPPLRKETGPDPMEERIREFEEYLLDIGIRI